MVRTGDASGSTVAAGGILRSRLACPPWDRSGKVVNAWAEPVATGEGVVGAKLGLPFGQGAQQEIRGTRVLSPNLPPTVTP